MNRNLPSQEKSDYSSVAPPANINRFQRRVNVNELPNPLLQYSGSGAKFGRQKRTMKDEDDYFDDDEEDAACNAAYRRPLDDDDEDDAPTSRKADEPAAAAAEEEEDPLDAFMAGIQAEVKGKSKSPASGSSKSSGSSGATAAGAAKKQLASLKGVRDDIDAEDIEESYYKFIEENPNHAAANAVGGSDEEDEQVEYDADGNPSYKKTKYIDPLPPLDHSKQAYRPFNKNFYIEHEDIRRLTAGQVDELRKKLGIKALGAQAPRPVTSFAHFNFDEQLMRIIRKAEYAQPTPIQAQAIPIALSGRDLIGIAKTGSGKTAAFIWPMLVHIMDQPDLKAGDGPIGLILAPTRELSQQIYTEAKKFAKAYNVRAVCAYGGGSKWEQQQDLEEGAELIIATPGRLIDLIKVKATSLSRVTMLVLDEADRMFAMGFEAQVRSICDHCRPDRQTMMFSATFKKSVERLARDALSDPIKIVQGELGEANQDVQQTVLVMPAGPTKFEWLSSRLTEFSSTGSVLIFVTQKANADELATNLKARDFPLEVIHGDFDQATRNRVITKFKRKEVEILIATDVAARGLDISHIRTVVNFDTARDIDTHTHRIGRTGRAGVAGVAYTLVTEKDKEFAGHLVRNLELANQPVPEELLRLAMQSGWFKKARFQQSKAKNLNQGGGGLGMRRPGLGLAGTAGAAGSKPIAGSTNSAHSTSARPEAGSAYAAASKNRLETMRMSYAAQFKSAFKPSSDPAGAVLPGTMGASGSRPAETTSSSNSAGDGKPKKRSRWQ